MRCLVCVIFSGPTLLDNYTAIIDSNAQVLQYCSQLQGRSESLQGKRSTTTTLFNLCTHGRRQACKSEGA